MKVKNKQGRGKRELSPVTTDHDTNHQNLLWGYSGFLVRRLWQIHVAMFMEETKESRITPVQFSILLIVRNKPGLDQGSVARELGLDRSNAADILARLERRKLIKRTRSEADRRAVAISLSAAGARLVSQLEGRILRSHIRLVEDLPVSQRELFKTMLQRIVAAKNELGRAPLKLG